MAHTEDHATRHKTGGADVVKLDEFGAPTDNTNLNVSTSAHGLCPKLPNDATKSLDGTGNWTAGANPFLDYCELQDQKALGVVAQTLSAGDWRTRDLNTELYDPNNFCSLAANRFTLTKGLYQIEAMASGQAINVHRLRIWSTTGGTKLLGICAKSEYANPGTLLNKTYAGMMAHISGQLLITAATETFELQHRVQRSAEGGFASGWDTEIYAVVKIFRVRNDA